MNIRPISADDTLQLRRDVLYPDESLEAVKIDQDEDGLHFGVFDQGLLVTVVSLFMGPEQAQFRKLATAPAARNKGYGKAILEHLVYLCKKERIKLLWCNARDTAVSFYDKLGYQQKGSFFMKNGISFVKMELQLDQTYMQPDCFEIIPAIDIIDGKCVRLTQGDYRQQKIYHEHPLEVAKAFEAIGIRRLHLVDLDGARKGAVVNWKVLENIVGKTGLVTDFGGGIKTGKDLDIVFECGAALATIGSVAVKSPELFFSWVKHYGADKIFLGADVKEEKIAVSGWMETTALSVIDFLESNIAQGVKHIFCTDISKDGLLQGPAIDLYKKIIAHFTNINFVASGGVSNIHDVAALKEIGCSGVIIGKAIYEGHISMEALKTFL